MSLRFLAESDDSIGGQRATIDRCHSLGSVSETGNCSGGIGAWFGLPIGIRAPIGCSIGCTLNGVFGTHDRFGR